MYDAVENYCRAGAEEEFRGNPRAEVDRIKELVQRYVAEHDKVNLDMIYSDPSEPPDLSMYEAVAELLDEGAIEGPPVDSGRKHSLMFYRRAT